MGPVLHALTLVAALGCAAMAGVFFAFSAIVMNALARLPATQGIAAMQSINVTAVRPAFMTALFGTAALCVALGVGGLLTWGDHRAALLIAGSAVYVTGTILLTIGYHVPLNDALADLDPADAAATSHWTGYVQGWTRWNHVRGLAALVAAAAFTVALGR
ncbi:MAG: DUF1772 domain-containing protein [Nocardioidaceae bacterium]|jgi:uncharacterized membrane protein